MNILTVEQVTKSYGDKILFQDASFGMEDQDKIGIIGVNGTGKSTFMRVIAGIEPPDAGKISMGNRIRVRYLAQNPEFDPDNTVLQQVFEGDLPEMKAVREYTETMELLELHPNREDLQQKLLKLNQTLDTLQAWQLESDAKTILSKLGIRNYDAKMGTLSGGQRKRVALAAALIQLFRSAHLG